MEVEVLVREGEKEVHCEKGDKTEKGGGWGALPYRTTMMRTIASATIKRERGREESMIESEPQSALLKGVVKVVGGNIKAGGGGAGLHVCKSVPFEMP